MRRTCWQYRFAFKMHIGLSPPKPNSKVFFTHPGFAANRRGLATDIAREGCHDGARWLGMSAFVCTCDVRDRQNASALPPHPSVAPRASPISSAVADRIEASRRVCDGIPQTDARCATRPSQASSTHFQCTCARPTKEAPSPSRCSECPFTFGRAREFETKQQQM